MDQGTRMTPEDLKWVLEQLTSMSSFLVFLNSFDEYSAAAVQGLPALGAATALCNELSHEGVEELRRVYNRSIALTEKGVREYERSSKSKARASDN
jgi:hypothetical protein